jgi:ribosomal protein S18 acetylase RimI-like enzyme
MFAEAILSRQTETGLRRFDMRRDLRQLADLIDLAFESEIEAARSSIVAEMRRLSQAGPLLWLLDASYATLSPLMGGFVWMADGRLVGNVTLSAESGQRGLWTITNVAVLPGFRRHGIGRQLMEAALDEARHRGARTLVLEVQKDNAPAQQLYHELGFERYDTVAELRLPALHGPGQRRLSAALPPPLAGSIALRKRRPADWQKLYDFFQVVTPPAVQAIKPVLSQQYRMDIGLRLKRWLDHWMYRCQRSDWILEQAESRPQSRPAHPANPAGRSSGNAGRSTGPSGVGHQSGEGGKIGAVLQITGQYIDAPHRLQMDVRAECHGTVEDDLLALGLHRLKAFPDRDVVSTVAASYPQALEAFQRAGFQIVRILDQMVFWSSRA